MSELRSIAAEMYEMAETIEKQLGAGLYGSQVRELADRLLVQDHIVSRKLSSTENK